MTFHVVSNAPGPSAPVKLDVTDMEPYQRQQQLDGAIAHEFEGRMYRQHDALVLLRDDGAPAPLSLGAFRSLVRQNFQCVETRYSKAGVRQCPLKVPREEITDAYHSMTLVPEIRGVSRTAHFTADHRLVNEHGLDSETGVFLWSPEAKADPASVTPAEVADVLRRLLDFEYANPAARLYHLCALLWWARGPAMQGHPSPLVLFVADERECGKSLANDITVAVGAAGRVSRTVWPTSEMEQRYSLASATRGQPAALMLDNLTTGMTLGGSLLQSLLTAPGVTSLRRAGGGAETAIDPTICQITGNGNQIGLDDELARRTLRVKLLPRSRRRAFATPDLRAWAVANRTRIVSVLLRIVDDWYRSGAPPPPRILGSFEQWSHLVGGPACHAMPKIAHAFLDPAHVELDPTEAELVQLIETDGWWPRRKDGSFRARQSGQILEMAGACGLDALESVAGPGSPRSQKTRFGRWLLGLSRRTRPIGRWHLDAVAGRNGRVYVPRLAVPPAPPAGPCGTSGARGPAADRARADRARGGTDEGRAVLAGLATQEENISTPNVRPFGGGPASTAGSSDAYQQGLASAEPQKLRSRRYRKVPHAVQAMAMRGVRVDPDRWLDVTATALEKLTGERHGASPRHLEEIEGRIKGLRSYQDAVWKQASTDPEQRVRCSWERRGAGRLQSTGPNLQGITKHHGVRSAVVPAEGHRFAICDWNNAHLWIAASMAVPKAQGRLVELLRSGDLYRRVGKEWGAGIEDPARQRTFGKLAALKTLNGAGADSLVNMAEDFGLKHSAETALLHRAAFLQFTGLEALVERLRGEAEWTSPAGRRLVCPGPPHTRTAWRWMAAEADALFWVMEHIPEPGRLVLTVHDEVVVEVPTEHAAEVAEELSAVMDQGLGEVTGLQCLRNSMGGVASTVDIRTSWDAADACTTGRSR